MFTSQIPICTIKTHRETIEKLPFPGRNQDHGTALAVSSDPPFGRKLAQRYDPVVFIVQHDLHALVLLRHQLGHQLPARAAGHSASAAIGRLVPEGDEAVQAAVDTLQESAGLEKQTIEYLLRYQWGEDLVKKLAAAVK